MSNELYVKWEPVDPLIIHQNLMKELDNQRKTEEEFIRNLGNNIHGMKEKIYQANLLATSRKLKDFNVSQSVKLGYFEGIADHEDVKNGYVYQLVESDKTEGDAPTTRVHEVDLSVALSTIKDNSSESHLKVEYIRFVDLELKSFILGADEVSEKNKLIDKINLLINDDSLDFDFFKALVDQNLHQFFRTIGVDNEGRYSEKQIEYLSLCKIIGVRPDKLKSLQLDSQIEMLKKNFIEIKEKEMFTRALREVVEEMGMVFEGDMQLDGLPGYSISDESIEHCSVFFSVNGNGLLMETMAEVQEGASLSQDFKYSVENSAKKFCGKHNEMVRRMNEKGFKLTIQNVREPSYQNLKKVYVKSLKKTKKAKLKEKAME